MNNDNKIVYVQLDTWNDMKDATNYLEELMNSKHDSEINYAEVWYDMAIIYCITTTESYIKKHPELIEFIQEPDEYDIFKPYYPEYNPDNFGMDWYGEYKGWAPYKDFNRQVAEHFQKQNKQNNEQYSDNNPKEN